jgi:uncharacterized membrane protein YphA (DoxX/SURF4 family)
MNNFARIGRCFYGIGIAGMGIQQFIYSNFRPVILPYWPEWVPRPDIWAYVTGACLVIAGLIIMISKNAKLLCLALGFSFLFLFICFHCYYQLRLNPNWREFASWINPLKELAFAGGAFIIAVSFMRESSSKAGSTLLAIGRIFFAVMLITFGFTHFKYRDFVVTLVPDWIPGHLFWTYFGAIALIGSGICILLKIQIRLVAFLLAAMLFIWFLILHIPRAIDEAKSGQGNELTSVFQALAFSGIALVIASIYSRKKV